MEYSISEFLKDIPTEENKARYTIENARMLYEEHRKSILNELKIKEIQKRATKKILQKESKDFDFLFYKRKVDTELDEMSDFLSDECVNSFKSTDENIGLTKQMTVNRSNLNNSQFNKDIREDVDSDSDDISSDIPTFIGRTKDEKDEENQTIKKKPKLTDFLDLEAEVSGDEDEGYSDENDGEYLKDPEFIASSEGEYDDPIEIHNAEIRKKEKEILKKLKSKFYEKNKVKKSFTFDSRSDAYLDVSYSEPEDIDEYESGNEEIKEIDEGFVFEEENMEVAPAANSEIFNTMEIEFSSNIKTIENRLKEKKEESWGLDLKKEET